MKLGKSPHFSELQSTHLPDAWLLRLQGLNLTYRSYSYVTMHCMEAGFLNWFKNHTDYLLLFPTSWFLFPNSIISGTYILIVWNGIEIKVTNGSLGVIKYSGTYLWICQQMSWVSFLFCGNSMTGLCYIPCGEDRPYRGSKNCFLDLHPSLKRRKLHIL